MIDLTLQSVDTPFITRYPCVLLYPHLNSMPQLDNSQHTAYFNLSIKCSICLHVAVSGVQLLPLLLRFRRTWVSVRWWMGWGGKHGGTGSTLKHIHSHILYFERFLVVGIRIFLVFHLFSIYIGRLSMVTRRKKNEEASIGDRGSWNSSTERFLDVAVRAFNSFSFIFYLCRDLVIDNKITIKKRPLRCRSLKS